MKVKVAAILVLPSILFASVGTADVSSCLRKADTQSKMNRCTGRAYDDVLAEMQRVLGEIEVRYAGDAAFIAALHKSQQTWEKLVEVNLEMLYPEPNKQASYGTAYGMCAGSEKIQMTVARIEFLKRWLNGNPAGDVCVGSILPAAK